MTTKTKAKKQASAKVAAPQADVFIPLQTQAPALVVADEELDEGGDEQIAA